MKGKGGIKVRRVGIDLLFRGVSDLNFNRLGKGSIPFEEIRSDSFLDYLPGGMARVLYMVNFTNVH